jgi:hypothetical protein
MAMTDMDFQNPDAIPARLRQQAGNDAIRITLHAHREMVEEDITLREVCDVLLDATLVENYPDHKRGACCLVCARTFKERYVHVVCTTSLEAVIIITVYEPKPPKWPTPYERGVQR